MAFHYKILRYPMIFSQNVEESCTFRKYMVLEWLNFRQNGLVESKITTLVENLNNIN